jgi:amino acid transporter
MATQEISTGRAGGQRTSDSLRAGVLSPRHVIFFVIAAAAPLGFSVGAVPLAIGRGGIGAAGMLVVCGVILAVFAVGYVAMSRHVRRVGGLYLFVMEGLGRPLGLATAFLAVLSYAVASTGSIGAFAIFAQQSAHDLLHWETPWELWAFLAIALMALLGLLGVELNARVLGIVILCEIGLLTVVSLGVVLAGGAHGLSTAAFAPHEVFGAHPGAMLAIAITAFAGFEATVLFAEEVKDGPRAIWRATFGSIAVMVFVYAFVTWAAVQAFGDHGAVSEANSDPTTMFFTMADSFVGAWAARLMELLVVTSWFAAVLAFHNATSRYVFALGRDRVVPSVFGKTLHRFGSPAYASGAHSLFTLLVVAAFALAHRDPYLDLFVLGSTPGIIGIPVMEFLTSVAVFAYFFRNNRGLPRWRVRLCPLLAALALALVVWLIVAQLDVFTGRTGAVNVLLVALVLAVGLAGCALAFWLRARRPDVYRSLEELDLGS